MSDQRAVPREFKWVFEKALAKARSERYQHMDDLVTDLRAIRRRLIPEQEAVTACRTRQRDTATSTVSSQAVPEPKWGLGWPILVAIGAALIAVATLLVLPVR